MKWTVSTAVASVVVFWVTANAAELKPETASQWEDHFVQASARAMERTWAVTGDR